MFDCLPREDKYNICFLHLKINFELSVGLWLRVAQYIKASVRKSNICVASDFAQVPALSDAVCANYWISMNNDRTNRTRKFLAMFFLISIAQNEVYGQQSPSYWASPGGGGYCISTPQYITSTPVEACNGMAQNLATTCGYSTCAVRGVWTPYSDQPSNGWCSVQWSCDGGPFSQTNINGGGGNVSLICAPDHIYWQNQCLPVLDIFSRKPLNACYGNPIYPMIGAKIQDESLGQGVAGQNISIRFSSQWGSFKSANHCSE